MVWLSSDVNDLIRIENFYSFFEIHYQNGFNFPGEAHNFWECVYVLDGRVCVSGDDRVYHLTKGEIIFHKPLELHKLYIDNKDGATLLIFSYSLKGKLSSYLQNKVFHLSEEQQGIMSSMLAYIHNKFKEYKLPEHTPFHQQYLLPFKNVETYSQMLTTYIYQLILSLADDGSISNVSTTPEALIFRKAINYMNSQICMQPSVSDIAAFCNISQAGLKRIFYKFSGIGVHQYFLTLKLKTATELLESGFSVTETAEKLGFSSQSYFSAVYKRVLGVNPSEVK